MAPGNVCHRGESLDTGAARPSVIVGLFAIVAAPGQQAIRQFSGRDGC